MWCCWQLYVTTGAEVLVYSTFFLHSGFSLVSLWPFQSTFCDMKDVSDLSFPLNLFPWHWETDISVSIWFWLQESGCYSKKMRALCLTTSTVRLQSFSSTEFLVFSTVLAEVLLVAIVFISYFLIVALFQWPQFSQEIMVGDFFQSAHQQL